MLNYNYRMVSEVMKINGNLLKSKRALYDLTQKNIAETIGTTEKTYNHKEQGKVDFKPNEIISISNKLKLTLEDINQIFFDGNLPIV